MHFIHLFFQNSFCSAALESAIHLFFIKRNALTSYITTLGFRKVLNIQWSKCFYEIQPILWHRIGFSEVVWMTSIHTHVWLHLDWPKGHIHLLGIYEISSFIISITLVFRISGQFSLNVIPSTRILASFTGISFFTINFITSDAT